MSRFCRRGLLLGRDSMCLASRPVAPWAGLSVPTRVVCCFFFFQAEDGIRDSSVTGVQTCALPIYRLRPGVSASVYLAFTVATAFTGDIPVGTRAQSIPGAGETAQFFETSETLTA